MNENEKMFLLELILRDIRGNWGWENTPRIPMAHKLASELEFGNHIELIDEYDFQDGRHFRTSYTNGGYEGMESVHGLTRTISDKTEEFKKQAVEYLTHPKYLFDDWEEFKALD